MQYSNLSSDKASAILQIIEGFNKSNSDKQMSNGDLKRYGAELTYTLSKNEDDTYNLDVIGNIYSEFSDVGNMGRGRYQIIGKLDSAVNNKSGTIGRGLSDDMFATDSASRDKFKSLIERGVDFGQCDCCATNRMRNELYIVAKTNEDGTQGNWYQVGTSCAAKVCKEGNYYEALGKIDKIANTDKVDDEVKRRSSGKRLESFFVEPEKLAACALAVSHFGYQTFGTVGTFDNRAFTYTNEKLNEYADQALYNKPGIAAGNFKTVKASDKVNETGDELKPGSKSRFTEWALYLYRAMYIDKGQSNAANALDFMANHISNGRESLTEYLESDAVKIYASEIASCAKSEINESVKLSDNIYRNTASETLIVDMADYVDKTISTPTAKNCGVTSFFHGKISLNNQRSDDVVIKRSVLNKLAFEKGNTAYMHHDDGETVHLINASTYCRFVPSEFMYRNTVNFVKHGEAIMPAVERYNIQFPETILYSNGTLNSGFLISNDGKLVLNKRGQVQNAKNVIFDNEGNVKSYADIEKQVNKKIAAPRPRRETPRRNDIVTITNVEFHPNKYKGYASFGCGRANSHLFIFDKNIRNYYKDGKISCPADHKFRVSMYHHDGCDGTRRYIEREVSGELLKRMRDNSINLNKNSLNSDLFKELDGNARNAVAVGVVNTEIPTFKIRGCKLVKFAKNPNIDSDKIFFEANICDPFLTDSDVVKKCRFAYEDVKRFCGLDTDCLRENKDGSHDLTLNINKSLLVQIGDDSSGRLQWTGSKLSINAISNANKRYIDSIEKSTSVAALSNDKEQTID